MKSLCDPCVPRPGSPRPRWRWAVLVAAFAFACTPQAIRGGASSRADLTATIDRALASEALDGSGAAILIVSLDHGDTLYRREADRLFTPASNRKLFTAASALHHLGPEYRFHTALLATGPIDGDTLRGDLVLVGRGDPDLVTEDLAALADTLVNCGVRVVSGDVRADASWFDEIEWGSGWMWDDGPYWEFAYFSALTLNDNAVEVRVVPGERVGDPVRVSIDPPTEYVAVGVAATTATIGAEPTLSIDRSWTPPENIIHVTGDVPADADSVIAVRTVEDPALYAVTVLSELLDARGVVIQGEVRHQPLIGAPADTIAMHTSGPLAESLGNMLKESDNLTAEQLVKVVGAEVEGPPGSHEAGLAAERVFLAEAVGIDTLDLNLADGSGVSRYNLGTARQTIRLLSYMANREEALSRPWMDALPVAGRDGTLESRMVGTAADGRARAKTGTLSGVSALSGYVPGAVGERFAFSMVMEFFTGPAGPRRAIQDSIVAALARFRR